MDPILFRGIERILICVGGIVIAYLGYKLYRHGVDKGYNELTVESKLGRFLLSGVGPGLMFMGCGVIVLITALYIGGVEVKESSNGGLSGSNSTNIFHLQSELSELRSQLEMPDRNDEHLLSRIESLQSELNDFQEKFYWTTMRMSRMEIRDTVKVESNKKFESQILNLKSRIEQLETDFYQD